MTYEEEYQKELTYFRMSMLQAEIIMQGMIAENKRVEMLGHAPVYSQQDFERLIEKHGIHHNKFPFPKH